jgi:hypothetical protein
VTFARANAVRRVAAYRFGSSGRPVSGLAEHPLVIALEGRGEAIALPEHAPQVDLKAAALTR